MLYFFLANNMLLLKTSSSVLVILMIVSEYPCYELRGFVYKVVSSPLLCSFRGINSDYSKENCKKDHSVEESRKEHSGLNSFGKDLTNNIPKKSDDRDNENILSKDTSEAKVIFPGTKWCGDGNISDSNGDLGRFRAADKCCREHDFCPEYISAGQTRYGLTNTGSVTRLHCDCDRNFYNCLKNTGTFASKAIRVGYFTVLRPQCFKEDYPIVVGCTRNENRKCVQYKQDTRNAKKYKWFDSLTIIKQT